MLYKSIGPKQFCSSHSITTLLKTTTKSPIRSGLLWCGGVDLGVALPNVLPQVHHIVHVCAGRNHFSERWQVNPGFWRQFLQGRWCGYYDLPRPKPLWAIKVGIMPLFHEGPGQHA